MTKIHFFKKTSKTFLQFKKFAAKFKAQKNSMQRFKSNNKGKFNFTICKKRIQMKKI